MLVWKSMLCREVWMLVTVGLKDCCCVVEFLKHTGGGFGMQSSGDVFGLSP